MASPLAERVAATIHRHDLIPPEGEVTCLVSGGADSTCLWHVLGELGYRVSAVHVNHGLRGDESEEDARFCAERLGAEIVPDVGARLASPTTEVQLRDARYRLTEGVALRATGHTASDQVETVLYRLVSSGSTKAMKVRREDGVVRPLLELWREDTVRYCEEHALAYRLDSSNADTKRGLIREEILPLLRRLHPGADRNLLALADERPRLPRELERTLVELLSCAPCASTATCASRAACASARGGSRARARGSSSVRGVPATGSRGARRRCRMCSWTRRCREPRATPGRWWSPATTS